MDTLFFLMAAAIVIAALSFGEQEYRRKMLERRVVLRPALAGKSPVYVQPGTGPVVDSSRLVYTNLRRRP